MSAEKNKKETVRLDPDLLERIYEAAANCTPPTTPRLLIEYAVIRYLDYLEPRLSGRVAEEDKKYSKK